LEEKAMKRISIFCLIFLVAGSAHSTQVFCDDFENYALYDWPLPTWVGFGGNEGSDPSNNCVVPDPLNSQNKVFKLFGMVGGCWAGGAAHPYQFPSEFIIQLEIYNGSETLIGCHPQRAVIGIQEGSHWGYPGRTLLEFDHDGTIYRGPKENGPPRTPIELYQTEQWYDVKIHYNRLENIVTIGYWINGVNYGDFEYPIDPRELFFDHFMLVTQEGTAYFDNVYIIPEPATLLLLGLGGLALLRKRRA
jgi:hypothetical protein